MVLWVFSVGWGVGHCLAVLNRTLGPEKEVQAAAFRTLPAQSYQIELLRFTFTFHLPEKTRVLVVRLWQEAGARLARWGDLLGIQP